MGGYPSIRRPRVAAIGAACRRHGLKLHMDGARFANALVSYRLLRR